MASRIGDGFDLLAAGVGFRSVREPNVAESSEDAAWVRAARRGERAAFGRLYHRYARMVHGVLLARVPVDEVDDLVQEVFLQALRRLSTLREVERFGAWLAAIARNRANDYHRRAAPPDQLPDDAAESNIEPAAGGDHQGPAAAVLDAIRALPEAYRETLIMRLVEGMTGPEIAARTGLTHGSVRVNLHRGMQQLRARLGGNPRPARPELEIS